MAKSKKEARIVDRRGEAGRGEIARRGEGGGRKRGKKDG